MSNLIEFVKQHIPPDWESTSGGWLSGNCRVCIENGESRPDAKRRGGFHFEETKFSYHCFNCNFKTGWREGYDINNRLKKLLRCYGAEDADIMRVSFELKRDMDTAQLLTRKELEDAPVVIDWPTVSLPQNSYPIANFPTETLDEDGMTSFVDGLEMLAERKILDWGDWHYCNTDYKYKNRMILPFRYKREIVGSTGRYIGTPPNTKIPKYFTHMPRNFVFNLDNQTPDRKFVIVTEGQLDAIAIDGVSIGGNELHLDQAKIIEKLGKDVIVIPDHDKGGMKLVKSAIARGWAVSFPVWESHIKDPNNAVMAYGKLFTLKTIVDFAVHNPTKAHVLAQQYCKG